MRRPLMWLCLCLIIIAALKQWICKGTADDGPLQEDREIVVTGRVYQKDRDYFYLDSISLEQEISYNSEISNIANQQNIPLTYHMIGQSEEFAPEELLLGSRVTVRGTLGSFRTATNPGEFDAAKYYRILKIGGKLTDVKLLAKSGDYSRWKEMLYGLKVYWRERLFRIFPEEEASVMAALLLGEKKGIDEEIKELYQRNGIVHILSISGLHITIIGMGIYELLRRLHAPTFPAALCGGCILLLYGIMTGFGVSTYRAVGMYLLRMAAEITGRTYDMLTAAALLAALMVWHNPLYLSHSGFLLSFGSVFGIGVFYPAFLDKETESRKNQRKEQQIFVRNVLRNLGSRLYQSILACLSITIMTLPIQLWFYFEVPTYSIVLNMIVIPFMTVVILTGSVAMMAPGLGVIGTVDCLILQGYEALCRFFVSLPFSLWNPGHPKVWQIILYYLLLFGTLVIMKVKKFENTSKKIILTVLVVVLTIIFALNFEGEDSVTFLDVGQGDCICLRTKEGRVYLFDCGSSSRSQVGKYVLKPFLKYHGISHIDGIFVSHFDADHCNGLEELLENRAQWGFTVGQLYLSPTTDKCSEEKWKDEISAAHIYTGDSLKTGEITITCLHPSEDFVMEGNAASQCFYVDFGENTLLLTGDVEKEGEESLLKELKERGIYHITVLKAAHHGSKNSTSKEFLKWAAPDLTVISCGRNNRYGHPHEELLGRLEEAQSSILRTQTSGAITLKFGRKGVAGYCYLR
ncbi:MAG: DNA internalization-related competence protein ComEC/Rec2 [Bacteroidales bacterium]|nr:DNA internalization-related competence protein ComEC/Rec2 [Lachnoclostridium sp.]MCM1384777.1 DNA internalization-related competence protein ComEC/Rec2 [Lachnoclostridium sp.]MCM1465079.1 DNA internalization-related competence protein ComEC/Rec2 [Bacteroidales bacterium]